MLGEFFGLSFGFIVIGFKFGFLLFKVFFKGFGKLVNNIGGKIVILYWSFFNLFNFDLSWILV